MAKLLKRLFAFRKAPYGGFVPEEKIAHGGMSTIWRARHPQTGTAFALKILTPESAELQDSFGKVFAAEEGKTALGLNHPNVIKTYEYGRQGRNEYYIVMEYVDGPNLETLILLHSPRVRENRFDLLLQVGSGLAYIHEQGLIHRDFCPKNVLYGSDGVAKIVDFGLSIPAGVRSPLAEARAGTASYMAPEQIRSQPLDERADVYAFGLSAFEILTCRRPFPVSSDRSRRMQNRLNTEPLKLRQVDPGLSERLEAIIGKCIEKDREMRYKSMLEVMRHLRAAVEAASSGSG
ncbi:MAG: serine/threonine protein kinase [Candidatus Brocadiaceae bacterium]|nr:serine/threonine protein kinase [Candidatus Brocadiaceae bacterium]